MGADITGITTNEKLADQYAWKNNLALPYVDGGDVTASIGATNTSLMTSWSQNSSSFQNGGGFYNSALFMNSTSDYPRINFSAGAMNFMHNSTGTGTIEFWANSSTVSTGAIWASTSGGSDEIGFGIYSFTSGTEIGFFISKGVSGQSSSSATGKTPHGKWVHIAAVKTPTELRLYTDGVLRSKVDISSYAFSDSNSARDYIQHGSPPQQSGSRGWTGAYMQDFRVYEGLEKYTGTTVGTQYFVPASTNPDILPDTPSGVAGGSKLTKITDGAVSFDGTGDSLSLAYNADWTLGSTWTIEAFIYLNAISNSYSVIASQHTGSGGGNIWFFAVAGTSNGTSGYRKGLEWYSSGGQINSSGNPVIDVGKWHHVAISSNSGTATMYVDGKNVGSGSVGTFPTASNSLYIGHNSQSGNELDGFISNLRIVKGTAVYSGNRFTPPSAPLTNVTNTKLLCCQSNSSAVNYAVSPGSITANGNAAATNFNPFNTDINTVRGQESGYATMNPLDNEGLTLSDGNLNVTNMGSARQIHADIFVDSGKWYAEFTCKAAMNDTLFGVANNNGTSFLGSDTNSWGVISINGNRIHDQNGSGGQSSYGSSFTTGDVISVALNMDSGKWYAAKNGLYFDGGNPVTGANPAHSGLTGFLTFAVGSNDTGGDVSCNFGQKPFKFTPPDGFQPLNTANARPVNVISRPDQYFNTTLWSGNNADPRQIDLGMAPDLIWVKTRNQTNWHWVSDSLRGTADKRYKLYPNDPSAEDTAPIYGQADSFNDFGFVAGGGTDSSNPLSDSNQTGTNYICWSWKAGGSKFTYNKNGSGGSSASDIGVSATTLTLTGASINTESKFGIYAYTGSGSGGATITHNLGGTPAFVIYKKRTGSSSSWQVYHKSLGGTKYMNLDEDTDAYTSDSTRFGGTDPTSTTITLGTHANDAVNTILYAWCDVPGLQKFGSYVATGQTDGPYIELGFRPRFILCKSASSDARNWMMFDSSRTTFNPMGAYLTADGNGQEGTYTACDFLSNGFKVRATSAQELNITNETYIYMAWAEAPSIDLFGGGANAR
jgi:hypothetical protein